MAQQTHYADADGVSIAYQVFGDGPHDVIVVPGFGSHVELLWSDPGYPTFMRGLARFARIITFDKRGTSLSDPVLSPPTLDERADDVRAVLAAAGVERATLFGWSEGGALAAFYAATHTEQVERLVLCNAYVCGAGYADAPGNPQWAELWNRIMSTLDRWGEGENATWAAPSRDSVGMRRLAGLLERACASPAMARANLVANTEIDIRGILSSIHVPTLVLHRKGDPIPIDHSRYLSEHIAGARFVELEGPDHWPFAGDVESIVGEVEEFVTGTRAAAPPDRVLATVMFTDIVRSTELAVELGDAAWREVLQRHDDAVREELAAHEGREVKHTGDGFLAVFTTPAKAVRCAKAIVDALKDLEINVRAGLHCGEVELRGDDVGGLAVHIGARIGTLADTNEVLVSGTVRDLLRGSGTEFTDRGVHTLKGVPDEWRLYALAGTQRTVLSAEAAQPQLGARDRAIVRTVSRSPAIGRFAQRVLQRR